MVFRLFFLVLLCFCISSLYAQEIEIVGNSTEIVDGDAYPSFSDDTYFAGAAVSSGTVSKTFTIKNRGFSTLSLSGSTPYVSISGTNSSSFSITSAPSNSISAGSNTTFTIEFDPSTTGSAVAEVNIGSNDADEATYNFSIKGLGLGVISSVSPIGSTGSQIGANIKGEASGDKNGTSVSLSGDGTIMAIGAVYNDGSGSNAGHVRVYQNSNGTWIQLGADIDGEYKNDESGISVSLSSSGHILAIGSDRNGGSPGITGPGHVRVFEYNGNGWNQLGADIDPPASSSTLNSGISVSLSGDGTKVAIGANSGGNNSGGVVRVYQYTNSWNQLGSGIHGSSSSYFGESGSLNSDGTTLAIGSPRYGTNNTGSAYVYKWGAKWTQKGARIAGEANFDKFGTSVSLNYDGTVLAIGAPNNDGTSSNAGHVRVYRYNSSSWSKIGSDIDGKASGDQSGTSVSLSSDGKLLAIGAPLNNTSGTSAGHVRIYKEISGSWSKIGSDINGKVSGDYSGTSVSMSSNGSALAIGSPFNDGAGNYFGHVRSFRLNGAEIEIKGNGIKIAVGDITPSNTDDTNFGTVIGSNGNSSKTFTIHNEGVVDLVLEGNSGIYAIISGPNASDFTVSAQPSSATIAAGNSLDFTIKFDASTSGIKNATVTILSNDDNEGTYTFDIKAEAKWPEIEISGNNTEIEDGDNSPISSDHTHFGQVNVSSTTQDRTFTVANTGNKTLNLTGSPIVSISGTNSADFSILTQPSTNSIAANGSKTFVVRFDPSAYGSRVAEISIANDDNDENPYNFSIEGNGLAPEIKIKGNNVEIVDGDNSPSTTDDTHFGLVSVSASTRSLTYTIKNIGTDYLSLTGSPKVSISGTHSADFSVTSQPSSTISYLGSAASSDFEIQFNPSSAGSRVAEISIANNDDDENPYTFNIEGTGYGPEIKLEGNSKEISDGDNTPRSADHTNYGDVHISSATLTRTFTIKNTGNQTLALTGSPIVSISGLNKNNFSVITQPGSSSITADNSLTFVVEFDPNATGVRVADVNISNNDNDEGTYSFAINGTGINPEIEVHGNGNEIVDADATPDIKDFTHFGSVDASSATKTRTFTIKNTGVGNLTLSSSPIISISGSHSADFSVSSQPSSSTIAASGSLTFVIEFNPSAEGLREAEISLTSNDANETTYNFSISGLGSSKANYPFDWTWENGSDTKDQSGTYGTKGTAHANNIPGARASAMVWKTADGTVYLFGGEGLDANGDEGLLNDLWKWDGSQWTWLAGNDTRNKHGVFYSGNSNRPSAREKSAGYVDGSGNLWLFGGIGYYGSGSTGKLNDLWKWDGTKWTWVDGNNNIDKKSVYGTLGQASASSQPRGASESAYWADASGNFWVFGGNGVDDNDNIGYLNDLWKWNGSQWAYMGGSKTNGSSGTFNSIGNPTSSTIPSARTIAGYCTDESGDLWLFGGYGKDGNGSTGVLNDLWKYDIGDDEWTWVAGDKGKDQTGVYGTQGAAASANKPGSRRRSVFWCDGSGNLTLLGGYGFDANGSQGKLNDMWLWNGTNWAWVSGEKTKGQTGNYGALGTSSSDNYPGARRRGVNWIDNSGNLWLLGGEGKDANGDDGYLNDMWQMDLSFVWNGASTSWGTNSNWKHGGIPGTSYSVKIPSGLSSYPSLSSDVSVKTLEVENGGTLTIESGKTLTITDGFSYGGSSELNLGTGTLKFGGSAAQTINGKINGKVEIDNSNDVSLGADGTIRSLTLTNGDLDIGNNNLALGTATGGSSSGYIKISGTGRVTTEVGSSPVTLPIGRNPYLPIIIDDGGGKEYTVGVSEGVLTNPTLAEDATTNQLISSNVVGETWTIQSSGAQNNVSVTVQWNEDEEETGFTRSAAHLAYWENGSSSWNNGSSMSASGSNPYTLTRTVNFTTNAFFFGLGSSGSALPVDLTYFNVEWASATLSQQNASATLRNQTNSTDTERSRSGSGSRDAVLTWQTAMEENNSHFEVQRSLSGVEGDWEQIGRVEGQGSTFETSDYQFFDNSSQLTDHGSQSTVNGEPSTIYYRLKQVDYDGKFEYSETRTLSLTERSRSQNSFSVWPNPSQSDFINLSEIGSYRLFDINGIELKSEISTNKMNVSDLPLGSYVIRNGKGNSVIYIRN